MSIVASLRELRHGPLKWLGPLWTALGNMYRLGLRTLGSSRPIRHKIGPYGPFLLHGEFTFSDFAHWGDRHNRGFELCVEACRGKCCVLDVGAHIGLVTLPMSEVIADDGRIFAFEPAEANRNFLDAHLALNDIENVTVVDALVGAKASLSIAFFEQSRAAGQNSVVVKKNPKAYRETRRRQITLDGFCRENDLAPEIIKIDVEGGEIGVLEGARDILRKNLPTIFLSVHPAELSLLGFDDDDLSDLISELGYAIHDVDGNPVSGFRLDEYLLTPK